MTYQIESKTEEHHSNIIRCLYALGYKSFGRNTVDDYINQWKFSYPWTVIQIEQKNFGGNKSEWPEYTTITFDKFLSLKKELEIEIKLNDEYTAIISKDNVKVGCQTFPLSVIQELYNALKKFDC